MKKKIIFIAVILGIIGGLVSTQGMLFAKNTVKTENVEKAYQIGMMDKVDDYKKLTYIMDTLMLNFVGEKELTKDELFHGAIRGMMEALDDPHSTYFSEEELKSFTEDIKGEYAGVGMVVSKRDKVLTVVSPIEDTPAYKAGMKPQDKIVEIAGVSTFELTLEECVDKLKGKAGTSIKVKVARKGVDDLLNITLTRALIKLKYVKYSMMENDIGYLRLTQFGENISQDIKKALEDLNSQNMKGLVFDLRSNPGGLLSEAVRVSSFFTEKDPIVTIKDKSGKVETHNHIGKALTNVPMVILINGGSASASEIVAGAIRDHKRGVLIGEKSFGKGSVQNSIPLQDGDAIKLTIAKYYTPSGESIHKKGINPDIEVKEEEYYEIFDGYVTNVVKEEIKEEKKDEENKIEGTDEINTEKTEEEKKKPVDTQLETAKNVLKGIILYGTK